MNSLFKTILLFLIWSQFASFPAMVRLVTFIFKGTQFPFLESPKKTLSEKGIQPHSKLIYFIALGIYMYRIIKLYPYEIFVAAPQRHYSAYFYWRFHSKHVVSLSNKQDTMPMAKPISKQVNTSSL